jgi:hypothetical protein
MVLFVGYPISYETACDFLGITTEDSIFNTKIKEIGLQFECVDKGQYVLGLEVNIGNLYDRFISVEDSVLEILTAKLKVIQCIKNAGIDMSDFMLQPIGEEPFQRVSNPEPYLISF